MSPPWPAFFQILYNEPVEKPTYPSQPNLTQSELQPYNRHHSAPPCQSMPSRTQLWTLNLSGFDLVSMSPLFCGGCSWPRYMKTRSICLRWVSRKDKMASHSLSTLPQVLSVEHQLSSLPHNSLRADWRHMEGEAELDREEKGRGKWEKSSARPWSLSSAPRQHVQTRLTLSFKVMLLGVFPRGPNPCNQKPQQAQPTPTPLAKHHVSVLPSSWGMGLKGW